MKKLTIAFFAVLGLNTAFAQENNDDTHDLTIVIPEVALLDIESSTSKNFTMEFTAPTEAGLPIVQPGSNSSLWLNLSSIKTPTETSRTVSAKLNQNLTGGVLLSVIPLMNPFTSVGQTGISMPMIPGMGLTTSDFPLIVNVGSGFTGDGINNGFQLVYTALVSPMIGYSGLRAGTETVTVTYTLSDN